MTQSVVRQNAETTLRTIVFLSMSLFTFLFMLGGVCAFVLTGILLGLMAVVIMQLHGHANYVNVSLMLAGIAAFWTVMYFMYQGLNKYWRNKSSPFL